MVETFYDSLFETDSGLRALFRGKMTEQKHKFVSTLAGIIAHLDNDTARSPSPARSFATITTTAGPSLTIPL